MLSEKIDVLQLTFYTAPVSCLMLFPFYLYREVSVLLHSYPQKGKSIPAHCLQVTNSYSQ